jgi:excinuclease ABC subunit A
MGRTKASAHSTRRAAASGKLLRVRGARENNLKDIDIDIPQDRFVVVTGVSGSGKSSLAFDTIYAEGQRRYVESLSAYARQFLNQNQKPDVDSIEGLSPAISIEQKSTGRSPRSTVATLTEIYDYMRLLWARIGQPHCYKCGKLIRSQSAEQMVDTIMERPNKSKFLVLAPVVRGRKGEYRRELLRYRKEGYSRIRIDGEMYQLEEDIDLDKQKKHSIELVVDRLVLKPDLRKRLADSLELALSLTEGLVQIHWLDEEEDQLYSEHFSCHDCGISYPELEPRMFSFNSPYGACENCDGLGFAMTIDPDKVVPDHTKSLEEGAIAPWSGRFKNFYRRQLASVANHYGASEHTPFGKLKSKLKKVILHGSEGEEITTTFTKKNGTIFEYRKAFEGVMPQLQRRLREIQSDQGREKLQNFMTLHPCDVCGAARLRKESLSVKINSKNIYEATRLPVEEALAFFSDLNLSHKEQKIGDAILRQINERLSFLASVGLNYLSLDRTSSTLSGGESQRIRLATQIGSALRGVIYVLDEPSIGLHQRDNQKLLQTLLRLRDLGNTVLVVEHDKETICAADHVIDMGPGAGLHGGEVVAQGTPKTLAKAKNSLTADYLSGRRSIETPGERRAGNGQCVLITHATTNNLKNVEASFPLGKLICVTGVSGSGKSTLVNETLYPLLAAKLLHSRHTPIKRGTIQGDHLIDKVIVVDQSPIGRTPRSNPATYTGLFTLVRELFAGLPESRARAYKPGRYSFNVKGGRCESCQGDGVLRIEMHFLPDVYVTCEQCRGQRYNRETLEVKYKGKNISELLAMSVDEAHDFLEAIPPIKRKLHTLQRVGLGYIKLGQSATTLSGGEAQRLKLSRELSKRGTSQTLYILDEPTTGLHFHDVKKLLEVLHSLVDAGNTCVVIEHNIDVIKTADHIIDLGPEGGAGGGCIVAEGTPEKVAKASSSATGHYLAQELRS